LRVLRWGFSTNDCAIFSCFFHKSPIDRPEIWRFFMLSVSLKHLTIRSTVDLEMAVFSSREVLLQICLTTSCDLWRPASWKEIFSLIRKINHRRRKVIRMNTLWKKIFQTVWKIFKSTNFKIMFLAKSHRFEIRLRQKIRTHWIFDLFE